MRIVYASTSEEDAKTQAEFMEKQANSVGKPLKTEVKKEGDRYCVTGLMLSDVGGTAFDYLAVGTDSTAPSASDTALGAEITDSGLARAAGTGSRETTTVTNDTAKLTHTWSSITADKSIRELGVFASGGTMLARATLSVDVSAGDSLTLTHKTVLSSS